MCFGSNRSKEQLFSTVAAPGPAAARHLGPYGFVFRGKIFTGSWSPPAPHSNTPLLGQKVPGKVGLRLGQAKPVVPGEGGGS